MNENNTQTENHPSPAVTPTDSALINNPKTKVQFHHIFLYLSLILFLITILSALFLTIKNQQKSPIEKQNTIPIPTILPTSSSDLSYLMIVADPNLDMKLLDMSGNQISEAILQQPITNPVNSENKNQPIKELYLQKPNTGNYKLITSSNINKISKVSIYFYDINGNIFTSEIKTTGNASFDIYFNKKNSKESYVKNK